MKKILRTVSLLFATTAIALAAEVAKISPAEAAKLVAAGKAVLVDVREPMEWDATGVAAPAHLLSTTDFFNDEKNWKDFLATVGDKTVITYCLAGIRAGRIADRLAAQGYHTANAGRFVDWKASRLPVRKSDEPRK